ncbi:Imm45 family immunity protein, partial [Escherichia coli]|uniref:Imm45 family immunity protein n=1 Tax=Escherichia coli TaxID=562 RepID=UPI003CE46AB8
MVWKKLVTLEDCEYIMHGAIFRVKGVWPYEEFVDFMLVDMPDDRTRHALVVSSGRKA